MALDLKIATMIMTLIATSVKALIELQKILKTSSLPNIPLPVIDAGIFWTTVCEVNGWKLEVNSITQHARIIDNQKIRRAWGHITVMEDAFQKLAATHEIM